MERKVKCFRCKKVIVVDVPKDIDDDIEVPCPYCDKAIPVYGRRQ